MPVQHAVEFVRCLSEVVDRHPQAIAIWEDGQDELTYRQLWEASDALAARIRSRLELASLKSEAGLVGIAMPKSMEFVVAVIAVWKCGLAWLPITPDLPSKRIQFLVKNASPDLWLVGPDWDYPRHPLNRPGMEVHRQQIGNAVEDCVDRNWQPVATECQWAYLIYTSGSTGQPKGVRVSHHGLVNVLRQQIELIGLQRGSRSLWMLSANFDASISDFGTALLSAATLVIETDLMANGRLQLSIDSLLQRMEDRGITYVDIPPSLLSRIPPSQKPTALQTVLIGGEVCPLQVVRKWAKVVRLINVYGPTEATICTSMEVCDASRNAPSIGKPIDGIEYRLLNDELLIAGIGLAEGYHQLEKLTSDRFVFIDGVRFYRTGDRVVQGPAGNYLFHGRIDRQLKVNGYRLEPGEIETALMQHPSVNRAAVGLREVPEQRREILVAFIEVNQDLIGEEVVSPTSIGLRDFLSDLVLPSAIPQHFELVETLPTTSSGKVDWGQLNLISLAGRESQILLQFSILEESKSDREKLAGVFQRCLNRDDFSLDDSFVDLGGDSLQMLEACALANQHGIPLTPSMLWNDGSVSAIIDKLSNSFEVGLGAEQLRQRVDCQLLNGDCSEASNGNQTKPPIRLEARREAEASDTDGVLLTGTTGFLGIRLLKELIEVTDWRFLCLVRGHQQNAMPRLLQHAAKQGIVFSDHQLIRIEAVAGDLAEPQFGWEFSDYQELSNSIDRVIHLAATVNQAATLEQLWGSNVDGVQRVFDLARLGAVNRIDYVSTLSVFVGSDRWRGVMLESDDLRKTQVLFGGYAQSKWAAEYLARRHAASANTHIYRLGLLTPDVTSGNVPTSDWLTLTIHGLIEIGGLPKPDPNMAQWRMDVTPVDHAAKVLAKLMSRPQARATFHLAHPAGVTLIELLNSIQRVYPGLGWLERNEFQSAATSVGTNAASVAALVFGQAERVKTKPAEVELFQATGAEFDMTHTLEALPESEVVFPLDQDYLDQMVAAILNQLP